MNALKQWIVWFGLGLANALLFALGGGIVVVLLVVLAVRVARRGDTTAALSGLLLGFGILWLALIAQQAASGGRLKDPGPWTALGLVPVAFGAILGALRLFRRAGRGSRLA